MRHTTARLARFLSLTALALLSLDATAGDRARLVISDLQVPTKLTAQERALVQQINLVAQLNDALAASRTFDVLVRDNAAVQALLREMQVQKSSIAREGKSQKMGLDIPDYILLPALRRFSAKTSFESRDLLPGMYVRHDNASMELNVRVIDAGGNTVFEKTVSGEPSIASREATEEDKTRAAPPPLAPFTAVATSMTRQIVDAINVRVNPIVVVKIDKPTFYILRGNDNGFKLKSRFQVFGPDEVIKTPQGRDATIPGKVIGIAEVVAMHEDVTELRLIEGDPDKLVVNATVRALKE